nr:hypothetical protein DVH24_011914 [Ipomoea trifida]
MPFKSETLSCSVIRRSEVVKFKEGLALGTNGTSASPTSICTTPLMEGLAMGSGFLLYRPSPARHLENHSAVAEHVGFVRRAAGQEIFRRQVNSLGILMMSEAKISEVLTFLNFFEYTQIRASAANPRQNAPAVTTPATAPGPCLQSWLWHFPAVFVCDVVAVLLFDSDGGMEGGGDVMEFAVGFIRLVVGGGGGEIVPGDLGPTSNEEVKLHHSMLWISVLP